MDRGELEDGTVPYMGERAPIVLCEFDGVEVVT